MTNEEAIKRIQQDLDVHKKYLSKEYKEALNMAIEALSADGDLISRAEAMGAVQDHFNADGFKGYDDGQKMMDRIKAVPSVSAERVGKWIFNGYADEKKSWFICSECDHSQFHKSNYCPNCGAKMKGGDTK